MSKINNPSYEKIWFALLEFDLDKPASEYNFSLRLQNKYNWTSNFTLEAIVEYKKFMFLASISSEMVSPSETIDLIWHQHLTFSRSYQDFCDILGKKIEHIPSNHTQQDFNKLKAAKIHTTAIYNEYFGKQIEEIWEYYDMKDVLKLRKAKYKTRSLMIVLLLASISLLIPLFYILKPIYRQIDNPLFCLAYLSLIILAFLILSYINLLNVKQLFLGFNQKSFIFNLTPDEVIYLQYEQKSAIIYGHINQLIENNNISINNNLDLQINEKPLGKVSDIDFTILDFLAKYKSCPFGLLYKNIYYKPAIDIVAKSMKAFQKYVLKSTFFSNLFLINSISLIFIFLLGFERILIGISRDKEIVLIVVLNLFLIISSIYYLLRLKTLTTNTTILKHYQNSLSLEETKNNWYWDYVLKGRLIFNSTLLLLIHRNNNNGAENSSSSSGCGSSCGGSCSGGSCGSGCGGCGGD